MRRVMSASRRVRKTGAVPVLGLTRAKVGGSKREAAVRVVDSGGIMQEEGAFGFGEAALFAAEDEGAEFEEGVDVWEEGRKICSEASVLEVETCHRRGRWWRRI